MLQNSTDAVRGRNLLREYLQARILESLQRSEAMLPLAFHGGTALRFLFAIPRYSEDLDFALENPGLDYDFKKYLRAIQDMFGKEGYQVDIQVNDKKTANTAMVKFQYLLYEFGLSAQRHEVLAVKIEVDTHPPKGAGLETTLVRRHIPLHLQHHDRASLLAGKIHTILHRPYVKGRDLYDLMWYLSDPDWPNPNLNLLQNALRQTGWEKPEPQQDNWREILRNRLRDLDLNKVVTDVKPFLEHPTDVIFLTEANFEKLLGCDPGGPHQ